MKILLTNPTLHYSHGHKFIQPDWPSLTLPYLAALMGDNEVKILDHSHKKQYEIQKTIEEFNPDIVAFSVIAGRDIPSIKEEMDKIDRLKIAGGQGIAYNQDQLNNVICFSDEAELALPNYLSTGKVNSFERCNLDDTPIPRWDLVKRIKSRTFNTFTGAIEMSRGCPFKCEFCAIANFWNSFRQKSNDKIIEELKYLSYLNMKHVYLSDDSFGINVDKHMELFDKILSNDLNIKFFTQIRADSVAKNPIMINMAAKAGLYGVLVGFDSYDDITLKENGKTTSFDLNNEASRILRKNNIAIIGSHIYALPGQTSFENTFKHGRKNSDVFAMPYFDGRPKIQRPKYDKKYADYVKKDQFSLMTLAKWIHPNKAIRVLAHGALRKYINSSLGYNKYEKPHN